MSTAAAATATVERAAAPLVEFRTQLDKRGNEFAAALPPHIKPDHFQRAAITAVQVNPDLLGVERRSLLNALMRCAQDGLIPDGREAALVIFKSKDRGPVAQYLPMVGGIRKLVQQSGVVSRFEQQIVYEHDEFEFVLGDDAHIRHVPNLVDRGRPVLAYSIAQFRDGSISREIMTLAEIEKTRAASKYANDGPWRYWWSEMARKTVAKRHAKSLPMSNDLAAVIRRDDRDHVTALPPPADRLALPNLAGQFDRIAAGPDEGGHEVIEPPNRRRPGRPRTRATAAAGAEVPASPDEANPAPSAPAEVTHDGNTGEIIDEREPARAPGEIDDGWPGPGPDAMRADDAAATGELALDEPAIDWNDPDVKRGIDDANAGRTACLDASIRRSDARFARWRQGFYSVTGSASA